MLSLPRDNDALDHLDFGATPGTSHLPGPTPGILRRLAALFDAQQVMQTEPLKWVERRGEIARIQWFGVCQQLTQT